MLKKKGYTIAFAGKGGTGKTTLAGLMVRFLKEHDMVPILAVDADSNTNFNEVLGLTVEETLGHAREQMRKDVPVGITKDMWMEMKVEQSLVEANGFDLIAMGQPEGPGCYCAANNLLSRFIDRLVSNYAYLVVDNEAGMEHFSRLTTKDIDLLMVVSDPSRRGVLSAMRIFELVDGLTLRVGRKFLLINQYRNGLPPLVAEQIQTLGHEAVMTVPEDDLIRQFDLEGKPTVQLPPESAAWQAAKEIYAKLLL
ncbi:MAG: AAA family ATPase [Deltaproteobacteria bacterium]|nr:AAA family ATPase [Deltaproteobacteria bacterium]MBW2070554.1 AAA family ATPase [Deltaproteobacteria bacterium]